MPEVGSSSINSFGLEQIDMPTSSTRCWPWDNSPARVLARAVSCRRSSTWSAISRCSRLLSTRRQKFKARAPSRPWAARRRFSRTLRFWNRLVSWNERAIPRPTRPWAGLRIRFLPSK